MDITRTAAAWQRRIRLAQASALLFGCSLAASASAVPLSVEPRFSAPATSYGTSSNSRDVFGDTDIAAFSYFVGSGLGVANINYGGVLTVDYPLLSKGQVFDIALTWTLPALFANSTFIAGATATIWALGEDFDILDKSVTIVTNTSPSPFPAPRRIAPSSSTSSSGSGCVDFDVLDLLLVSAGGSLCLEQSVNWNLGPITGKLEARLGGYDLIRDFSIGSSGTATVRFEVPALGRWTLDIDGLSLSGSMDSDVDVNACANIDVAGFDPVRFGCTAVSAYSTPSADFAFSTSVFGGDPSFIVVAVPGPPTLLLVGGMFLGILLRTRRRR